MDLDVGAGLGGGDEPQVDLTLIRPVAADVPTIRPSLGLAPTTQRCTRVTGLSSRIWA
jgi:hypothetical protein